LGALNNIDATVANELAVKYPVDVEKNNI